MFMCTRFLCILARRVWRGLHVLDFKFPLLCLDSNEKTEQKWKNSEHLRIYDRHTPAVFSVGNICSVVRLPGASTKILLSNDAYYNYVF